MKIYIAADHAGFDLKATLFAHLSKMHHDVVDVGDKDLDPNDDYPQYAYAAVTKLLGENDDARAILVCGSGQGMCMAANRVAGIRAALCWNEATAKETREDNDSNVLCVPARFMSEQDALNMVDVWLATPFSQAPRHVRRLHEVEELFG